MKNKIFKLLSIMLAVSVVLSCCVIGFTASATGTEHTYYVSSTGSDSNDGTTAGTAFMTYRGAIDAITAEAIAGGFNTADDTVYLKVDANNSTTNWLDTGIHNTYGAAAHNFKLVITTDGTASQAFMGADQQSIELNGPTVFEKCQFSYARTATAPKLAVTNSLTIGSDVFQKRMAGPIMLGTANTKVTTWTFDNPITFTNNGDFLTRMILLGSQLNSVHNADVNVVLNCGTSLPVTYYGYDYTTHNIAFGSYTNPYTATFNNNVNLNIKQATDVTLIKGTGNFAFGANSAVQILNATGNPVNYDATMEAALFGESKQTDTYILNNGTGIDDLVTFTATAGTYTVDTDKYSVTATDTTSGTVYTAENGELTVPAGEYTLDYSVPAVIKTYYVSAADGDNANNGEEATPFRTIGGALTAAVAAAEAGGYNFPNSTVYFKVLGTDPVIYNDMSNIAFNFKLNISSATSGAVLKYLTASNATIFGGDVTFENIDVQMYDANYTSGEIYLNGKSVTFGEGATFTPPQGISTPMAQSYFFFGAAGTEKTFTTPQTVTFRDTGTKAITYFNTGGGKNSIYNSDFTLNFDVPNHSQEIKFDADSNKTGTFNANVNLNLISSPGVSLWARDPSRCTFGADSALQIINSTGHDVTYANNMENIIPENTYFINNLTDVKDIISFTGTAGTYNVKEGYNVTAIASDKSTVNSNNGQLVLTPGTYKLITSITPAPATDIYSDYIVNRGDGLKNTYLKLANNEDITVGYFGGSVTGGAGVESDSDTWRGKIGEWLTKNFPVSEIRNYNFAVGGTGSTFGVYRAEASLLTVKPDLVFVEFAINDKYDGISKEQAKANFETIVRMIRETNPNCDIVTLIITDKANYANDMADTLSSQAQAHDEISEAYGIPSIYIGRALADKLSDINDWGNYFADSVHPNEAGYEVYYQVIKEYFNNNLANGSYTGEVTAHAMPNQVSDRLSDGDITVIKVDQNFINTSNANGGSAFDYNSKIAQYGSSNEINPFIGAGENDAMLAGGALYTHSDGKTGPGTLVFEFSGTELLVLSMGQNLVGYNVSIDGGDPVYVEKTSVAPLQLASNLESGNHTAAVTCVYSSANTSHVNWIYAFFTRDITKASHNHVFGEYVSDNNATCTADGTKTAKCLYCDLTDTVTDVGSAGQHVFADYVSNNDATCTEDGTKTAKCLYCDATDTITDEGSALGHSFTNYVSDGNATCTDGTKTAHCDRDGCDATDTIPDVGSGLGHLFTNYVSDNNATCTDGTKTAHCDREGCDATDTIPDVGSGLGHLFTNYVSNNDATCTEDGTKTAVCDREGCNETNTVIDEGSAKGHKYSDVITVKATTSKDGQITTKCSVCGDVKGTTKISKISSVKLSTTSYTYNGKAKKPTVTVKDSAGKTLKNGTDYTVTYPSGLKKVGSYTVKVTFKGKYSGTKSLTFKINPKGTKISKLTAATKSLKVSIKKQSSQTTGYEVQYSTSKKFTSAKKKTIKSYKTTSYTIKSLKAKTTYYVRVRTYKTVNGKKYYSGWSTYKYKKTK